MKKKRLEYYILIHFIFVLLIACFFLGTNLLRAFDLTKCSFYEMTNLYCPGCGGTRAVSSLLKLNVLSSFKYNAIVPIGFSIFLFYDVKILKSILKNDMSFFDNHKYIPVLFFVFFLVLYFIVRNVFLIFGIDFMV